jgi:hypothetical protein
VRLGPNISKIVDSSPGHHSYSPCNFGLRTTPSGPAVSRIEYKSWRISYHCMTRRGRLRLERKTSRIRNPPKRDPVLRDPKFRMRSVVMSGGTKDHRFGEMVGLLGSYGQSRRVEDLLQPVPRRRITLELTLGIRSLRGLLRHEVARSISAGIRLASHDKQYNRR